jgi:hypothetical protein
LNGSIGTEEAAHVQHGDVEALADEVAGVVHGDAVRRRSVTSQDEDPLETVLRNLCADIRNQRAESRVTDAIRAWVDEVSADDVRSGLTVVDGRQLRARITARSLRDTLWLSGASGSSRF